MGDDYKFRYGKTLAGPAERPAPAGTGGRTADPSGGSAAPVESRVKFLGHAVHQQLIPFPFGLLATAVIFDVVHLIFDSGELANVAYWMIVAGIVGGLVAAPFGLIDWTGIPKGCYPRSRQLGGSRLIRGELVVASWGSDRTTGPCSRLVLRRVRPCRGDRLARRRARRPPRGGHRSRGASELPAFLVRPTCQ